MEHTEFDIVVSVVEDVKVPARCKEQLVSYRVLRERCRGVDRGAILDCHNHRPLRKQRRETRPALGRQIRRAAGYLAREGLNEVLFGRASGCKKGI